MLWNQFKKPHEIEKIIAAIKDFDLRPVRIMEVCGTHTMAIAKSGIKSILPSNIKLVSGPGCPVCVTPTENIDAILELAKSKNVIIATYGDMLRVPGTKYGENLERSRALGAEIVAVYSAIDAVEIAKNNPLKEVVFLGIGFETTTPGTALALETAINDGVNNFYVMSMHKLVEPVLRTLLEEKDFEIDGFLCPGHVGAIIGERGFEFLVKEYNKPSVICGFEAGDIIASIYKLIFQIKAGKISLDNMYTRIVSYNGNEKAVNKIFEFFETEDDVWRGMGLVKDSGLKLKNEYERFDAIKRFSIEIKSGNGQSACSCGEVIKGKQEPNECPLFGKTCTPENPVGPCMVSSEGACAAYYKYQL